MPIKDSRTKTAGSVHDLEQGACSSHTLCRSCLLSYRDFRRFRCGSLGRHGGAWREDTHDHLALAVSLAHFYDGPNPASSRDGALRLNELGLRHAAQIAGSGRRAAKRRAAAS